MVSADVVDPGEEEEQETSEEPRSLQSKKLEDRYRASKCRWDGHVFVLLLDSQVCAGDGERRRKQ